MSNKKRIKNKVDNIQRKKQLKLFSLACQYATTIINRAIEAKRKHYLSGGFIPYDVDLEKIINASKKIIKENPDYNKFTIKDKDFGSATYNINKEGLEKIIDSHGDEMILPKFEIKRHPYFLHTHKPEQS